MFSYIASFFYKSQTDNIKDFFTIAPTLLPTNTPKFYEKENRFASPYPWPLVPNVPIAVDTHKAFRDILLMYSGGSIRYLDNITKPWKNFIISGSCVTRCLTNPEQQTPTLVSSDIDIFIFGENDAERRSTIKTLILQFPKETQWVHDEAVMTGLIPGNPRKVQIIFTDLKTPKQVIGEFDSVAIECYYDGQTVWVTEDYIDSFCSRSAPERSLTGFTNLNSTNFKLKDQRIEKFRAAGFSVFTKTSFGIKNPSNEKEQLNILNKIDNLSPMKNGYYSQKIFI